MLSSKKKTRFTKKKISKKIFMPEFNRSFLPIKISIDSFVRLIAGIFSHAGLLDEEDDLFNTNQLLTFSDFGEMIFVSAKNINWRSKKSIPQICLWLSSIALVIFVLSTLLILLFSLATGTANAALAMAQENTGEDVSSLFTLTEEVAKHEHGTTWLNWMFNLAGEYKPAVFGEGGTAAKPGIALGFQSMLTYYSSTCLILGSIMVSYLFVDNIVDTASTGKFMGQGDEVWAYPRILIAMCLLVPLPNGSGLNIGQNLIISISKAGSIFATNTWLAFLKNLGGEEGNDLISPESFDLDSLSKNMFDSFVCYWGTAIGNKLQITDNKDGIPPHKTNEIKKEKSELSKEIQSLNGKIGGDCEIVPYNNGKISSYWYKGDWNDYTKEARKEECEDDFSDPNDFRITELKDIIKKADNIGSKELMLEQMYGGLENPTSIKITKASKADSLSYDFNLGSGSNAITMAGACGSYGPAFFQQEFEEKDATRDCISENPHDLNNLITCTEAKMQANVKKGFLAALNKENVFGFISDTSEEAATSQFQIPSVPKGGIDAYVVNKSVKLISEKNFKNEKYKKAIKAAKITPPTPNSLSSYAYDFVLASLYSDKSGKNFIPKGIEPLNYKNFEDSLDLIKDNTISLQSEEYGKRFSENMAPYFKIANESFRDLNSHLFGNAKENKKPAETDIANQMQKGWIAAGAFYSLLSQINGLGIKATSASYAYSSPISSFTGSRSIKIDTYSSDKMTGFIPYLDYILTKKDLIIGNIEKKTTGISSTDESSSMGSNVAMLADIMNTATGLAGASITNINGANPFADLVNLGHLLINTATYTKILTTMKAETYKSIGNLLAKIGGAIPYGAGIGSVLASKIPSYKGEIIKQLAIPLNIFQGMIFSFGITLAYYLPLVPFIKFIMGGIGWFAAVFQAVIGTPLLLLGHITVKKGSMILGPDRGKYMMILEIFLRPVLMVFGMIGSMLLLSVATYIFNDLYNFAWGVRSMNSVWGGSILSFASYFKGLAYISIYVTTIYTIATNCFKLIDDVPGKVISWMGGGAGYSLSGAEDAVEQGAGSAGKFIEKSIDASRQKSLDDEQTNKKKNIARDDRIKDTIVKHGSEKGNMLADMEEGKYDANKGEYVDMSDQEKKEAKQRLEDHRSGGDPYGIRAKENASTSSTGLNQDGNMNIEPPKKDS